MERIMERLMNFTILEIPAFMYTVIVLELCSVVASSGLSSSTWLYYAIRILKVI